MLYSTLYKNDYLYLSFHAEQVYQNFDFYDSLNLLDDSNLGYFASELKIETIERVKNELKKKDLKDIKHIVIDFDKLIESRNPPSEFDLIIKFIIGKKISLSLLRIGVKLYENLKLKKHKQELGTSASEKDFPEYTNFFINNEEIDTSNYDEFIFKLYNELLLNKIENNYIEDNENKYSNSSNVYLPKYINIKCFIEEKAKGLTYFGLYLLCKNAIKENLIPEINKRNTIKKTKLFFQSLNGAYLASIISKLALIDMAYIDHIGPINKIYRTILRNNFENQNYYLIMSDVICMGTEIEITKSLIQYENSIVKGNLTIVKIEAIKGKKELQTCSLLKLTKENNNKINYKIYTEFE